ncbi:MAG TPA: TlpA disulfide reductase family protein [Parafilimonas sp.]|nr:TlpA disulfide reductase family protein [Parafilimonas sp.]
MLIKNFRVVILFIFFCFVRHAIAAQVKQSFIINGKINSDSGEISLMPLNDESYYPVSFDLLQTNISNGKFYFKGSIPYPLGFRIGVKINSEWKYISDIFLADTGEQDITCDIDSLRELPHVSNKSINELKDYNNLFNDQPIDKKSFLLNYTTGHPNSYIALWKLVYMFSGGYEAIYDSVYSHFSDSVKKTYTATILARNLHTARTTAVGNSFPFLKLLNAQKENVSLKFNNHFTLIDFWFSHCNPCISQFDQLKAIFQKYNQNGFQIAAISIDGTDEINNWKQVILKYKLPWQQFLDLNGMEADKLSIKRFPTNFLIDRNGKIIAKDIGLSELDALLKESL